MTPARSERSGEVRVPAPRGMMKEGGEVVDDDDFESEEDVDAEYSTETIGDELVAAWGMREEPAEESEGEEEGEDTSERPLIEDDEDDYEEDLGDLGDVVDMSLERIDDFDEEEYEDDNLKVEGQVSNRRVDLGDVERVREPWPTKSRQGASTRQPLQQVEENCYIKSSVIAGHMYVVMIAISGQCLVTFAAT